MLRIVDCGYRAGRFYLLFEANETSCHPYYPIWFEGAIDALYFIGQMRKESTNG